jgi:hypothetical protein
MPPRKFGIEYELCLDIPVAFNPMQPPPWDEQIAPYLTFLHTRYETLPEAVKTWCATFENSVYVYTARKQHCYDFSKGEYKSEPVTKGDVFQYNKPILMSDYTVFCHSNYDRVSDPTTNKRENYDLISSDRFTINVEFVTQILSSFDEWEYFKQAIMPPVESVLVNKSQGVHLNIGVSDLDIEKIKDILIKQYVPWEKAHSVEVRPVPSEWARILNQENITNLPAANRFLYNIYTMYSTEARRKALEGILAKEKSVHYKKRGILEFRIFSPNGKNIEEGMREVYSFFPPVADPVAEVNQSGKGRTLRAKRKASKKLKRSTRRHTGTTHRQK